MAAANEGQLKRPQRPSSGQPISRLNWSIEKVLGLRSEGAGHPEMSLQAKAKKYTRMGRPNEMPKAPGLRKMHKSASVCASRFCPVGKGEGFHIRAQKLVAMLGKRGRLCLGAGHIDRGPVFEAS